MTAHKTSPLAGRLVLATLLLSLAALPSAGDWPQFRGPNGDGHSQESGLPLTWSEDKNVSWKTSLPGRGWSSPIVSDGKVWMTTALDDERSLRVLGVDAASGEMLHDVEVFRPAGWQETHGENSNASPTPVAEAGRLYVHFGAYGTACLDTADASILWRNNDLQVEHGVGPGSSPILWRHLLIVHFDGTDERFVAAFEKATGKLAWKAPRSLATGRTPSHRKAFSTPLVMQHNGIPMLISPAAGQVSALAPATGEEIWTVQYEGYSNVPRPVAGLGLVFVDTGYIKPHMLAIDPSGRGNVTETHVRWRYHWQVPANPSPLLIGERLYMVSDWGNASWLDAHRGEDIWRQRLKSRHYASPIFADGRIYNFGMQGRTVVLAPEDEFQQLSTAELEGRIRASPAVADGAFFIRTESHLYRVAEAGSTSRRGSEKLNVEPRP